MRKCDYQCMCGGAQLDPLPRVGRRFHGEKSEENVKGDQEAEHWHVVVVWCAVTDG